MDMNKAKKLKAAICERIEAIDPAEIGKPALVTYGKELTSWYNKLCEACELMEQEEYSERGRAMRSYRDGPEWGAYRRGRDSMGRYTSYADGYAEDGMAYGGNVKAEIKRLMEMPGCSREDRDALKRAYEAMR